MAIDNTPQIVDEVSSRLGIKDEVIIPVDATHRRICRFSGPSDPLYLPVLAQIKQCYEKTLDHGGRLIPSLQVDKHFGMCQIP